MHNVIEKKIKRGRSRRAFSDALACESRFAHVWFRESGIRPTHEDAPLLMSIWQLSRDVALRKTSNDRPLIFSFKNRFRATVSAVWDSTNRLSEFTVFDACNGRFLMAGNMDGPIFPDCTTLAVQAAIT